MNDTTKTLPAAPVDDVRARNKAIVFAALAEARIHRVTIEYDGAGDSGQIEDLLAWDAAGGTVPLPSDHKLELPSPLPPDNPPVHMTLQEAVETLAYDYLDTHPGWENNDGAFGTFLFDVPARTVTLDHNERYTEVNTTSDEF